MHRHLLFALSLAAASFTAVYAADNVAPCTIMCDTEEAFAQWTVINANTSSAKEWTFNAKESAAAYSYDNVAADDWIISPAVEMQAGVSYDITAFMKGDATYNRESFAIVVGADKTVEAMTTTLFERTSSALSTSYFTYYGGTANKATAFTPETDGIYYVGIHCYSARYNGDVYLKNIKIDKIVPYPGAATNVAAKAAADGVMQAVISWTMPATTNLGGPLTAVSGAKIYRGTSSSFALGESALIGSYQGGYAGEECSWTDDNIPAAGKYYYAVVPFDENGDSPSAVTRVQSDWIGMDTSVGSIPSVTATAVEGSETAVTITWEQPSGSNGGPIDTSALCYKIVRKAAISGESKTLEETYTGTSYTDASIPALDKYTYTVYTVYNGTTAWSGKESNEVTAGGALSLPFTEDFSSSNALTLWTCFHGSEAKRDWAISSSALNYWGNPADAWAVTPKFNLKAGVPYELTFNARVNRTTSPKDLYIYWGTAATAESLSANQVFYKTIDGQYATSYKIIITVPEDGQYHIAFRCYGPSDVNDLYVDDLSLTEGVVCPLGVAELKAEAGEEGAMQAVLSWINPDKTNTGTELAELTKIEIRRGNAVIATLTEGLTPGQPGTYTDNEITEAGKYTYSVRTYTGENTDDTAVAEASTGWVGPDTPAAPASVTVTIADEGREIAFETSAEGVNGGYIDANALHYVVTCNDDVIADNVTASPYTDNRQDLEYGTYTYTVKAVCGANESDATAAAPVKFGAPLELPFNSDFSKQDHADLWTLTGDKPNNTWTVETFGGYLKANYASDNSWAFTPPLNIVHSQVKLTLEGQCWTTETPETIEVYLCTSTDHTKQADFRLVHTANLTTSSHETSEASFVVTEPGTYYLGYRLAENAHQARIYSTSLVTEMVLTGVDSPDAETAGKLRYSRAYDRIETSAEATVSVYDTTGRLLLTGEATEGWLSTDALPSGLFVATAVAADGTKQTLKFAK